MSKQHTIYTPVTVMVEATPSLVVVRTISSISGEELTRREVAMREGSEALLSVNNLQAQYTVTEEPPDPYEQIAQSLGLRYLEGSIWVSRTAQYRKTKLGFELVTKEGERK